MLFSLMSYCDNNSKQRKETDIFKSKLKAADEQPLTITITRITDARHRSMYDEKIYMFQEI